LKALNHIANRVCSRPLVLSLSKDEPECSPSRSRFDTLTTSGRSKGSYERVGALIRLTFGISLLSLA
jgi:hypothetical protein